MRTGPDLIQATRKFASDSTLHSWWSVASTGVLLVIALAGTLYWENTLLRILSSVLSGLLILRSFVLYHDQQHHSILSRSRFAEILMQGFGVLALSASSVWRSSHNHHHNHNSKLRGSHIGSFPIMTKSQYLKSTRGERFQYLFARHPLTILFGYVFVFLLGMCIFPFLNDPKRHWDCLAALLIHISIGVVLLIFTGWQGLLLFQTLPHFIAYAIGSYLFYAQHNFPDVKLNDKSGWTYEKAALESSSYMKMGPLMAWFSANIGYHHVHHLNSRIPFYRLPEAVASLPELQNPRVTTLSPRDIIRCLRLKVWDVDAQRMVGIR